MTISFEARELGEQKVTLRGALVCAAVSAGELTAAEAVKLADAALEAMAAEWPYAPPEKVSDLHTAPATTPQKVYVLSALNIDRGLHCVIAVKTSLNAAKNLARARFGDTLTWTERSWHGSMWVDDGQNYAIEEFKVEA